MNHAQWLELNFPKFFAEQSSSDIYMLLQQAKSESRTSRYFLNGVVILVLVNIFIMWLLPFLSASPAQSWPAWLMMLALFIVANVINQRLETYLIRSKLKSLVSTQKASIN